MIKFNPKQSDILKLLISIVFLIIVILADWSWWWIALDIGFVIFDLLSCFKINGQDIL